MNIVTLVCQVRTSMHTHVHACLYVLGVQREWHEQEQLGRDLISIKFLGGQIVIGYVKRKKTNGIVYGSCLSYEMRNTDNNLSQ